MSNLYTLEEIANNIGNMFSVGHPIDQVLTDIDSKTSEQIRLELMTLDEGAEQKVNYIHERTVELEKLVDEPFDFNSPVNIQTATQIISDVRIVKSDLDIDEKTAKQLNDNYKQKLLSESDFESYEDVVTQKIHFYHKCLH
ncbi:hypothetical protein ISS04_03995 [Candidatus Woesearchaeota archaeon]|nr:hypothetical protein [Candidatus Woesearchaeota archaeon]